MNFTRIVCLDLEMCCWDDGRMPRTGEIIEIGVAELDLLKGEVLRGSQYLVRPDKDEISEFCTGLTGHTASAINEQGIPLAQALDNLVQTYGGTQSIYASWGRDDLTLLSECRAKGIPYPFKEFLNLATLFRIKHRVVNQRFGHRKAMAMAGLNWEGPQHEGLSDARNLARLAMTFL